MAMNRSLRGMHVASVGNYQKGGKNYSPYMYRREIDFHPRYSGATSSEQAVDALNQDASEILSITNKIQFKEGLCFRNSPIFQQLLDDPTGGKRFHAGPSSSSSGGGGGDGRGMTMSKGDLEEQVEEYNDEKEEKKEKRKKQRDPSVKEVREHLRMIIQYHEKEVEKSIPSIYPVLGPCGDEDSENENNGGGNGGGKEGRVFKPVTAEIPKKKRKKVSVSSIKGVKRKKSTGSGTKKKK